MCFMHDIVWEYAYIRLKCLWKDAWETGNIDCGELGSLGRSRRKGFYCTSLYTFWILKHITNSISSLTRHWKVLWNICFIFKIVTYYMFLQNLRCSWQSQGIYKIGWRINGPKKHTEKSYLHFPVTEHASSRLEVPPSSARGFTTCWMAVINKKHVKKIRLGRDRGRLARISSPWNGSRNFSFIRQIYWMPSVMGVTVPPNTHMLKL